MKTITSLLFLLIPFMGFSQDADLMYVPDQNTIVATYNSNYSPIGYYVGGYVTTTRPQPYIYTTPMSILNRVGISLTNHKVSVMGGVFIETYIDEIKTKPDVWVKIYPLRIITNTEKGFDFTVGVNYMEGFRYGVGVVIPFR
mgnify:FL=1|jgi:hypothetical protein